MRSLTSSAAAAAAPPPPPNVCTINLQEHVRTASTAALIDQLVDLMRSQIEALPSSHFAISLDAEWEIEKNAAGFQM